MWSLVYHLYRVLCRHRLFCGYKRKTCTFRICHNTRSVQVSALVMVEPPCRSRTHGGVGGRGLISASYLILLMASTVEILLCGSLMVHFFFLFFTFLKLSGPSRDLCCLIFFALFTFLFIIPFFIHIYIKYKQEYGRHHKQHINYCYTQNTKKRFVFL